MFRARAGRGVAAPARRPDADPDSADTKHPAATARQATGAGNRFLPRGVVNYSPMDDKIEKLKLAHRQLERVQMAWDPPDWADLSHYGFHALENAVDAACTHFGLDSAGHSHWQRVEKARQLHRDHGLDDIADLLRDLNATRKSESYGDVTPPPLNAEDTVASIEKYVEAVTMLLDHR